MHVFVNTKTAILLYLSLVAGVVCGAQTEPVRVGVKNIQLPTYLLGPEDPNPPFRLINSRQVYPYTMLDNLTDRRELTTYRSVVLENEYLRATILPELGGRLYSLYDKKMQREILYRNDSVKYGLIGLRGAWISGGIEFNFPNGHSTDTVSQVSSSYRQNIDGSATVWVGDIDQVSEMYWQVALTLRPGEARLEEHVTLMNPAPVAKLYWFWNNAAVPATEDSRFVYPMRKVTPDSRTELWTYPVWKGIDYSRYKNIHGPTEFFGVHVQRNFFGSYYLDSDFGVAHVADYRDVPGKKVWTWGVAGDGAIWTDILTDKNGPYNEIQSGHFETQLNQDFMPSQEVLAWTEYWYPVQHLGDGFVEATKECAVNVKFTSIAARDGLLQVSVSPTETIDNATLTVRTAGKELRTFRSLAFEPLVTRTFSVPVTDLEAARNNSEVEIVERSGRVLLHWSSAEPVDGNPDGVSSFGTQPMNVNEVSDSGRSVQQLFEQGVLEEQEGAQEKAQTHFEDALRRDPNYLPVLRKLAMQQYRAANYRLAKEYIKHAMQQNDADPETQYLAGIIFRMAGDLSAAQDALRATVRLGGPSPQALIQLGEISISTGDYASAEEFLYKALDHGLKDTLARSDLAVALRSAHKLPEAAKVAAAAVNTMPLYPVALAEQWRIAEVSEPNAPAAQAAHAMWTQAVGNQLQSYSEAGSWYWGINDWRASDFILMAALERFKAEEMSPMVYYYLASNAQHEGSPQRSMEYARRARAAGYDKIFCNRLSDVSILQEAISRDPTDAHAQYLLGIVLFQYGRYDEAEKLWRSAQASGFESAVLYRNLGLYARKIAHNLLEAGRLYRKAAQLDPKDYRLYVDLDEIYAQEGANRERENLFAHAPQSLLDQDTVRLRDVLLLIEERHYNRALTLLKFHTFKPWEQGENVHAIFVFANIEEGRRALKSRRLEAAQEYFKHAFEYPTNLGIGRPDKPNDESALYWLGYGLKEEGKIDEANRDWRKLLTESSDYGLSAYYRALALAALGQHGEAITGMKHLADGPAQGFTSAQSYYVAGLAELYQSRVQEANTDFQKALDLNPLLWQAQIQLRQSQSRHAEHDTEKKSQRSTGVDRTKLDKR